MTRTNTSAAIFSRRTLLLAGASAFGLALAPAAWASDARRTLRIGTEGVYAPFSYRESGRLTGYDVEVARAAAARLGIQIEFVEAPWDALVAGVAAGRFDAVFNQVEPTEERRRAFAFTSPYMSARGALVMRRGAKAPASLEALKGRRVAATLGSNWMRLLEAAGAKPVIAKDALQTFTLVATGRAEAALNDETAFGAFMKANPKAPLEAVLRTEGAPVAALFSKKNADLADRFSTAFVEMAREGELKTLSLRHLGVDAAPALN